MFSLCCAMKKVPERTSSCVERRNMRENMIVRTHQDLIPFLTQAQGMSCVHAAAQLGCVGCLKWMVEHIGMNPNEGDSKYGATPIHYAASAGHVKVIKFLLPRLSTIHVDHDGATPLHDAAVQGHIACVQELLKSTLIDPHQTDNYGLTASEWAEQAQEKKCAKLISDSLKKTATLQRKKKGTLKKDKQSPITSPRVQRQMSDGDSPNFHVPPSNMYAQLESPPDCVCEQYPQVAPQLPDTPRPCQLHEKAAVDQPNKSQHDDTAALEDGKMLPPPPDSMIQSLTDSINSKLLSPSPSSSGGQYSVAEDNRCYYINSFDTMSNSGKPFSAVPPFNHNATSPTSIASSAESGRERKQDIFSPMTTPPAPTHSFSTFSTYCSPPQHSTFNYGNTRQDKSTLQDLPLKNLSGQKKSDEKLGHYQNSDRRGSSEVTQPPQSKSKTIPNNSSSKQDNSTHKCGGSNDIDEHTYYNTMDIDRSTKKQDAGSSTTPPTIESKYLTTTDMQLSTAPRKQLPTVPSKRLPTVPSKQLPTVPSKQSTATPNSNTPSWKQEALKHRAKKQSGLAETPSTPQWKKLIQERKLNNRERKTSVGQQSADEEAEPGLAPWQSEIKRTGRVLLIETETD